MFTHEFKMMSLGNRIAFLGLSTAVGVVFNFLGIPFGLSNKLTFTYLASFLVGFLLGPLPAFISGLAGDFIGWLLKPDGPYWLFGVTLGLFGMISGAVMNYRSGDGSRKRPYLNAVAALAVCFVAITCVLNSAVGYSYLYIFFWDHAPKKAFFVWLGARLGFQSVVYAVNSALCFLVLPAALRVKKMMGNASAAKKP